MKEGYVDPMRAGVTGVSYGGNMSAWLAIQDTRFAAVVPQFPHTDYVSFHFTSNIPEMDGLARDSPRAVLRCIVTLAYRARLSGVRSGPHL